MCVMQTVWFDIIAKSCRDLWPFLFSYSASGVSGMIKFFLEERGLSWTKIMSAKRGVQS